MIHQMLKLMKKMKELILTGQMMLLYKLIEEYDYNQQQTHAYPPQSAALH